MGVFPEIFAVSTIIMASFVDPIIGEFNKRYGNVYGVLAGLISSIVIYQLIIGVFFYATACKRALDLRSSIVASIFSFLVSA